MARTRRSRKRKTSNVANSTAPVALQSTSQPSSSGPFLGDLPTEIRHHIFSMLLDSFDLSGGRVQQDKYRTTIDAVRKFGHFIYDDGIHFRWLDKHFMYMERRLDHFIGCLYSEHGILRFAALDSREYMQYHDAFYQWTVRHIEWVKVMDELERDRDADSKDWRDVERAVWLICPSLMRREKLPKLAQLERWKRI